MQEVCKSGCGSVGRVRGLGPWGRRFESSHPDQCASVAELADALDLGSSVFDVGVQVLSLAPEQINFG